MKSEGHVYHCAWETSGGMYRVWVKDRPAIAAEGGTFEEADEQLYDAITEATGDGENIKEYDPPSPLLHESGVALVKRLALVWPVRKTFIVNADELYEGGLCSRCKMPLGSRTAVVLAVESLSARADGMTARLKLPSKGIAIEVYSEEFLGLLTKAERTKQQWRPITSTRKRKRAFFELLASKRCIPFVALENIGVTLMTCETCGRKRPPLYSFFPPTPSRFVSSADIPRRQASILCVGGTEPRLAATAKRWATMVGRTGSRELASSDVGVVDPDAIDANPEYP